MRTNKLFLEFSRKKMSLYLRSCILTLYHKVYKQIKIPTPNPTPSLSFLSLLFWPDIQAIIIKGQHSLLSQPLSRDLIELKHEICGHSFGHAVCGQLGALQVSIPVHTHFSRIFKNYRICDHSFGHAACGQLGALQAAHKL